MKLTNKDFELFKSECQKWIKKFELSDWNIKFLMEPMDNTYGMCKANYGASNVIIKIASNFPSGYNLSKREKIKETALHECLELLLMPVEVLAGDRGWDEVEFTHQTHRIINKLMNIL